MDTIKVGYFIASLRKTKGLTQKELADLLGVTDKAISRWETGKGLPDTSLLIPLADALGVSVSELLSAQITTRDNMQKQSDNVIVETLQYSRRRIAGMVNVALCIIGAILLVSPLFLAGTGVPFWIVGIALMIIALARMILKTNGVNTTLSNMVLYVIAIAVQIAAFITELLPGGAILIFAAGPGDRLKQGFSYFDLTVFGFANFSPMLTGLMTVAVGILLCIALVTFKKAAKLRNAVFICSVVTFLLSFAPLLYGGEYMTGISYTVSALLGISLCLQAVANRNQA